MYMICVQCPTQKDTYIVYVNEIVNILPPNTLYAVFLRINKKCFTCHAQRCLRDITEASNTVVPLCSEIFNHFSLRTFFMS